MEKKYYIGLDVGTESVGWAVTDADYSIKRFKGNAMWGIRLFDESKTAAERRSFRTARRRLNRRGDRLRWLEEIFAEEICKIDPEFFVRHRESGLHFADKSVQGKYALFSGSYTDKEFHKDYPTAYHLRLDLIKNGASHDVRLVYLALHHIIKYRGHFLFEDLNVQQINDFRPIFEDLIRYCKDNYGDENGEDPMDFTTHNLAEIENVIRNRAMGKTAKKNELAKFYSASKKSAPQLFACLGLLAGCKEKLSDVFADDILKESEKNSISFSDGYSENEEAYAVVLGERFELIEKLKAVYDWGMLADIRQGEEYISAGMVTKYRQHRNDLNQLKKYVRAYFPQEVYAEIFKQSKEKLCNYVAYSGHVKDNGKTGVLAETATQEEFCIYLKKRLGECKNEAYQDMFQKISAGTFCPKLRSADNGVIPMQLHRLELVKILENAGNYLPFLSVADENGVTAAQKVVDIFDYKIPYYVGPLNNRSGKYWVKRTDEKVYPWNIRQVVDYDSCAEAFIDNLTNQCTYLPQCDVLPKNSILFSKFTVLNEINPLKLDGEPITVENLYVSPKIKRPIYQTLLIVQEIVKTQGCPPEKIFLEVAKGAEEKKRTKSRKTQLEELYAACKKDYAQVWAELCDIQDADRLKSDKLFLYFAQCGRCMYTGERIDLGELMGSNSRWDIDHIYPQSKIKDDSLHNNRVLARKEYNNKVKGPRYPLPANTQAEMTGFWKYLLEKKLITPEKYNRLICRQPLTEEQLSAFISRQLVETRQSTKAIAGILGELYPDTEIVYVKAGLVSDFRQENELIKSRDVNDLHHAKDAYLNIVVGNVYNVQCTHNKANFIKGLQNDDRDSYSMNGMFRFNIVGAWDRQNSMNTVKKQMAKNNILYTRYSFKQKGGLFDQQLVKKGFGQVPVKANGPFADGAKYGRYNRPTSGYFCFAEFTDPGKDIKIRGILPVDLYKEKIFNQQPEQYIAEHYGVENVKILIPCIQYNACIALNGFRIHLSSKSSGGKTLVYKPAVQLVLTPEQEAYIKRLSNYLGKNAGRKITAYDKLTADENITLYNTLAQKLTDTVFKKNFDAVRKCVLQGRDLFVGLETEKQCFVLSEILKILHANVMSGNLEDIGGAKKSGIVTTNSRISAIKGIESAMLIHQSVTGLYEHQVDLLNM